MDGVLFTPVTALYAGLLGPLWLILTWGVIRIRRAERISLGDGNNGLLRRRIRGQANFSESVPLVLILMLIIEINGVAGWFVHGLGLSITLGRYAHAAAFWSETAKMKLRVLGMILTLTAVILSSVAAIITGLGVFY